VAGPEPEIAAKKQLTIIQTIAKPPFLCPTNDLASAINLSEIDDEFITIDYENVSFSYNLPFTINIENTKKQFDYEIISDSIDRINLNDISIFENGLIVGHNFDNYENALYRFMEILPKLRRNITRR